MADTQESALTTITSLASGDKIRIIDDPGGTPVSSNVTIDNFLKAVTILTEDTAPSGSADYLLEYDASATAAKKVKPDTLLALVNGLTEDTNPDESGDYLLSYDTSAGTAKKVKPSNLALSGSILGAFKTADETVNNSTTLQNDDALLFAVSANKHYRFWAQIIVETVVGSSNDDIKFGWSYPSGTTAYWGSVGTASSSSDGLGTVSTASTTVNNQGITATPAYGYSGATTFMIEFSGVFIVSSTAGTINLQWAQNTAGARDLKVKAGSNILYMSN